MASVRLNEIEKQIAVIADDLRTVRIELKDLSLRHLSLQGKFEAFRDELEADLDPDPTGEKECRD